MGGFCTAKRGDVTHKGRATLPSVHKNGSNSHRCSSPASPASTGRSRATKEPSTYMATGTGSSTEGVLVVPSPPSTASPSPGKKASFLRAHKQSPVLATSQEATTGSAHGRSPSVASSLPSPQVESVSLPAAAARHSTVTPTRVCPAHSSSVAPMGFPAHSGTGGSSGDVGSDSFRGNSSSGRHSATEWQRRPSTNRTEASSHSTASAAALTPLLSPMHSSPTHSSSGMRMRCSPLPTHSVAAPLGGHALQPLSSPSQPQPRRQPCLHQSAANGRTDCGEIHEADASTASPTWTAHASAASMSICSGTLTFSPTAPARSQRPGRGSTATAATTGTTGTTVTMQTTAAMSTATIAGQRPPSASMASLLSASPTASCPSAARLSLPDESIERFARTAPSAPLLPPMGRRVMEGTPLLPLLNCAAREEIGGAAPLPVALQSPSRYPEEQPGEDSGGEGDDAQGHTHSARKEVGVNEANEETTAKHRSALTEGKPSTKMEDKSDAGTPNNGQTFGETTAGSGSGAATPANAPATPHSPLVLMLAQQKPSNSQPHRQGQPMDTLTVIFARSPVRLVTSPRHGPPPPSIPVVIDAQAMGALTRKGAAVSTAFTSRGWRSSSLADAPSSGSRSPRVTPSPGPGDMSFIAVSETSSDLSLDTEGHSSAVAVVPLPSMSLAPALGRADVSPVHSRVSSSFASFGTPRPTVTFSPHAASLAVETDGAAAAAGDANHADYAGAITPLPSVAAAPRTSILQCGSSARSLASSAAGSSFRLSIGGYRKSEHLEEERELGFQRVSALVARMNNLRSSRDGLASLQQQPGCSSTPQSPGPLDELGGSNRAPSEDSPRSGSPLMSGGGDGEQFPDMPAPERPVPESTTGVIPLLSGSRALPSHAFSPPLAAMMASPLRRGSVSIAVPSFGSDGSGAGGERGPLFGASGWRPSVTESGSPAGGRRRSRGDVSFIEDEES